MSTDSVAITNLLYRYAECMDNGDFTGAAALFGTARIRIAAGDEGLTDAAGILALWESSVIRYPDGAVADVRDLRPHTLIEVIR